MNRYSLNRIQGSDKNLIIPIDIDFSNLGQEQSIELYEEEVISDIVGLAKDYETTPFVHKGENSNTSINYNFYFYSGSGLNTASNWVSTFVNKFSINEMRFNSEGFSKSFFKLDFYDTPTDKRQKNYLTVILNANKSNTTNLSISGQTYSVNYPNYKLDYGMNGFNIYWLGNYDISKINTFYVSCKFYDAKTGSFIRMMNDRQSSFSDPYDFDYTKYFYYKFILNYETYTYQVYDGNNILAGIASNPINWFQYVNP